MQINIFSEVWRGRSSWRVSSHIIGAALVTLIQTALLVEERVRKSEQCLLLPYANAQQKFTQLYCGIRYPLKDWQHFGLPSLVHNKNKAGIIKFVQINIFSDVCCGRSSGRVSSHVIGAALATLIQTILLVEERVRNSEQCLYCRMIYLHN